MQKYLPRIGDDILRFKLECSGAVLIEGPKWCGKTCLAEQQAASVIRMQDPDRAEAYALMLKTQHSKLLEGPQPRLIDEWQDAPQLWNGVRLHIDQHGGFGHFILTGSATPRPDKQDAPVRHTGTGRIARLRMRPMTLWESKDSNGTVSLKSIFDGQDDINGSCDLTLDKLAFLICRGGWPVAVTAKNEKVQLQQAVEYVNAIVEEDIHRVDGVEKNPTRVSMLLKSLARNISTLATQQTLMDDIHFNDSTVTDKTLAQYLTALERIFAIENVPAWGPSLRSKTVIRTAAKRQFADPSIATAALRIKPTALIDDLKTCGFLFESLVTRDLRVYAQPLDGDVYHYRDKSGLETDLIIRLADGRWGAVEVKLGVGQIDEAATNLLKLKEKIDEAKTGSPAFLMVVSGTCPYAMKRPDGILVVPIGCLKP